MPTQLTEARPGGEWTQVFEQMQESLAQTTRRHAGTRHARRRGRAPTTFRRRLNQLDQQLARFRPASMRRNAKPAETDAWLQLEKRNWRCSWLDSLQTNQRKLSGRWSQDAAI